MLALVRLLTGVSADVDSQGTSLNEALATARGGTSIRPLICVNSIMSLQVRLAVEALSSKRQPTKASKGAIVNQPWCIVPSRTEKGGPWAHSQPAPKVPLRILGSLQTLLVQAIERVEGLR
jgi:hypothetical protein